MEDFILTADEWNIIENCLAKTLLPIKGTGLSYEINKFLVPIRKELKSFQERVEESNKDHQYKDEKGEPFQYLMKKAEGGYNFVKDGNDYKIVGEEYQLNADEAKSPRIKIDKGYIDTMKKYSEEKITIKLTPFDETKISKLFEEKILDGIDITCLFGNLIKL